MIESTTKRWSRRLTLGLILGLIGLAFTAAMGAATTPDERRAFRTRYLRILRSEDLRLDALIAATGAKAVDDPESLLLADRIADWRNDRDRDAPERIIPLPEQAPVDDPVPGDDSIAEQIRAIRHQSAVELFALAEEARTAESYAAASLAYRAAAERDPSLEGLWPRLGYVQSKEGRWVTPFVAEKLPDSFRHPDYGWIPDTWREPLEQGQLPAPGGTRERVRWISVEQANEARRDFDPPWLIRTEHFVLRTNVPLDEAVGLTTTLEGVFDVFATLLGDVLDDAHPLAVEVDRRRVGSASSDRHSIYFFENRDQFLQFLDRTLRIRLDEAIGFYNPPRGRSSRGTSFFFHDPDSQIPEEQTLYHEVSHQLLFENAGRARYTRNRGHYWVFESIATYFETLRFQPDGAVQIGAFVGPRLEAARKTIIESQRYVPLADLVRMNEKAFNDRDDIYLHYAEAMALAVFLIHYDDGRYREGFLEYLRDAYLGRLRNTRPNLDLERRLGIDLKTLDTQFLRFLERTEVEPEPVTRIGF